MKPPEYKETNGIPICPFCQKPTRRTLADHQPVHTDVYYPPIYDEAGINVNLPARSHRYECLACGKTYTVSGNQYKGYQYIGLDGDKP